MVPFATGVMAALIGLFLYNALNRPPQPLTTKQVNALVAQAMASATPPPAFSAEAYRVIQPSLVLIQTNGLRDNGISKGIADHGLGSGVVISEQGLILTALHVVDGAANIDVTFADGTQAKAKIATSQAQNDIAVLQPNKLPKIVAPAVMGAPGQVGDEAFAAGNPFGLYGSLTSGVISGLDRSYKAVGSDRELKGLIQFDAAVNPGNSGGPLLNRWGQVTGVVVGVLNPTDQQFFVGIGFAVPIATAAGGAGAPQY